MPNVSWQTPSNSWQAHLRTMNETDAANRHFGAFIDAMATENSKIERINTITEDPDSIMLVVEGKKIKFIHSCKKFGGTRTNPTTTVAGLIGLGARAFPIVIDQEKAATSKEVSVPSDARIWACKDITELRELDSNTPSNNPPPAASGARTRSQRGASTEETTPPTPPNAAETAASESGTQKYMAPPVFLPLPFLGITALEFISDDPLVLIEAIKNAAINFNEAHKDSDPKFDSATKGAKLFMRWLYAVHKNLVQETRLSIEPDNVKLLAYAEDRHSKCILPSLEQISRLPHGIDANDSVIRQLIQATNGNNKVCKETNRIRQAEYDWKKDVDETKKDRTKDLHPSIKLMIENASATVRDNAGELGEKFMSLYNMKTHGGLDIELHQLFEDKGMGDVGFAEGVATNIWAGIFTRTQKSTPGAFFPFSFSEQTALSSKSDKDRSLLLEIYSSTKGGLIKSIDDVKASAKTTVSVPQDFHSFLYQLKAFTFAVGFIFGEDSILATKLLDFVEKVDKNSIVYKNRIATDNTFAAKILWSVDCFTQLFLEDCRKCLDREDVDQRVIDFDGLNLDVLLYRFHMDLPSFFHIKSDDSDEPMKKGKRKGGSNGNEEEPKNNQKKPNKIINDDQVKEFTMAEGETWEETFQGKCPEKRVKWMGTYVCPRYHTKGECYARGCKYAKTHLPASAVPQEVKTDYLGYMACCRRTAGNTARRISE